MTPAEYIEQRIEALAAAGRLDDTQIDRAVAKGLLRQAKAAEAKGKKPPQAGGPKK